LEQTCILEVSEGSDFIDIDESFFIFFSIGDSVHIAWNTLAVFYRESNLLRIHLDRPEVGKLFPRILRDRVG
jgi:hypothetical protein